MSGKKAYGSVHKYGRKLAVSAAQITLHYDMDNIHSFRTTVKKMRALLRWLSPVKKTLPSSFKKIYHISGELRNAQVLLQHTATAKEELTGFRNWLTANITRLEEQWYKAWDKAIIRHLHKRIGAIKNKKGNRQRLRRFCKKRVDRINSILYLPSPPDESLHDARKMLKDMQYLYEWSEKKGIDNDKPALDVLKRIGHQAGDFNDQRIALVELKAYLEKETPEGPVRQAVMATKDEWEAAYEKQKQELIATLQGFVKGNKWG